MPVTTAQPGSSGDDGYIYMDMMTPAFNNSGATMRVGNNTSLMSEYSSFMRFPSVDLEQGDTISAATIDFTLSADAVGTFDCDIQAEDVDDSSQPTNSGGVTGATKTTASVAMTTDSSWTADSTETTPDIASVIQEVVNRIGWFSGNAITIYFLYGGAASATESIVLKTYDGSVPVTLSVTTPTSVIVVPAALSGQSAAVQPSVVLPSTDDEEILLSLAGADMGSQFNLDVDPALGLRG
jgi:hypothetical protein